MPTSYFNQNQDFSDFSFCVIFCLRFDIFPWCVRLSYSKASHLWRNFFYHFQLIPKLDTLMVRHSTRSLKCCCFGKHFTPSYYLDFHDGRISVIKSKGIRKKLRSLNRFFCNIRVLDLNCFQVNWTTGKTFIE